MIIEKPITSKEEAVHY